MSFNLFQRICPKCDNDFLRVRPFSSLTRCENCNEPATIITCPGITCKFSKKVCVSCGYNFRKSEKNTKSSIYTTQIRKSEKNTKSREVDFSDQTTNSKKWSLCGVAVISVAVISIFIMYYVSPYVSSESHEDMNIKQIKRLKSYYVSQKNETWYHLLSALEKKIPSVKSITFLHGEDKKTLNCLTNELISLYTTDSNIKVEEITFSLTGSEVRDYGIFLEHYHAVVEKFRVLVTDLNRVPGDIARLFHSLCDEESSDIKPSLFIFTLKYDKKTADLKPIERATTILKEAWRNLPQNEIFPLLSRIIKNVIDVVPEQKVNC